MQTWLLNGWILLSLLAAAFYVYIIIRYVSGWYSLPEWALPVDYQPVTSITILIPARNEAASLPACLQSIARCEYPPRLLEVIVLDDHSTDETWQIAHDFSRQNSCFKVLKLADYTQPGETQSFKKKAITTGVAGAGGELIVCTDADCEAQPLWLALLAAFYEKKGWQFIAAPVGFFREKNGFERFQSLDFAGMMCVTGAGIRLGLHHICNGANLAYPKAAFEHVGGFSGIDHLATGDDILLMQKIAARYPGRIGFLKNQQAAVLTTAKPDVPSFLSQRIRWASKSTSYKEWNLTFILGMVFLFCICIVGSLLLIPWLGWQLFAGLLLVKMLADWFFLGTMAAFFRKQDLMKSFLPSQFLHIAYIVAVGILGNLVKRYEWKGRRVR